MCGIAGFINNNGMTALKEQVKKMTDTLIHRGPDSEGQYVYQNIGLGHRRLSILDLSENGKQPMLSHDGRYVIVFNGEIYNYVELKQELKELGASFQNNTDTEVIIEGYRYWGKDCVNRLNGMWAFVLYDQKENVIFGSRDRMGVKPFYYLERDDIFAFASEPKAILEICPEEREYSPTMVYRFLKEMPEDMDELTFYKNIYQLEPAHSFFYNFKEKRMEKWEYWFIDADEIYEKRIKGKNPVKVFKSLLEDAVKIRLRSDVEIGSSLSGGLDSSTLVGIMSKKFGRKVNTFSSCYEDVECNEKEYIDEVNSFTGSASHLVYPDGNEHILEDIKDIVYHHDGPNGSASLYSGYSVYKEANKFVKVLVDGQGADELLGGYLSTYNARVQDILEENTLKAKIQAMKTIAIFDQEWPEYTKNISTSSIRKAMGKKVAAGFDYKRTNEYAAHKELFYKEFEQKADKSIPQCVGKVKGQLNQELYVQLRQKSIPYILHNVDGNSMAFSLEIRLPFLDYRIIEFCMALDGKYKIKNQWTKWILRKSCKEYLPKKVVNRKNKMGFPAPFGRWLKEHEQKEEMKDIIFSLGKRKIVKQEVIEEYYRQHMEGDIDRSFILYKFLTLELWLRSCVDNKLKEKIE